ncbi:MAG: ATP-binding protein [Candidatus Auribacterota bacterium]
MIISVASGKGGTGKTTVAVNLALALGNAQYLDCDVEEPNGHLFLKPVITERKTATLSIPEIDESKCTYCGTCGDVCAYSAIAVLKPRNGGKGGIMSFPHLCHGCGACAYFCPNGAITEIDKPIGIIEHGDSGDINFVHGKLNVGEIMVPPIISQVKEHIKPDVPVIIDAPPGTSCPVIEAIKGSDYCIMVTEPTPFGLNDLQLAVKVIRQMGIPFGVVMNKEGIGDDKTDEFCRNEGISMLMKIPFSHDIAVSYSKGEPIISSMPEYKHEFLSLYDEIRSVLA